MANQRLTLRNVQLKYRNFSGKKTDYNDAGKRNFVLVIPEDSVEMFRSAGLNVKEKELNNGDIEFQLKVNCRFDIRPPRIKVVTYPNGKQKLTDITEDTVGSLDWMEFQKVDITVSCSHWTQGKREGVTAYVETLYVTPIVDPLDEEYTEEDDECPFD